MKNVEKTIESEKLRLISRLQDHPFLVRCRNGQVGLGELKILLVQQGIYSSYFTRYLCAMMANLPSNTEVYELAENLFEELGFSPESPTPHYLIYRDMLQAFGLSLEDHEASAGTQNLIDTMFDHCRRADPSYGLGALCLGAEALVPSLYADLVKGFEANGVAKNTIQFFHIHIECDDDHAETLAKLMAQRVRQDPFSLARIVAAGDALVDARQKFLDSIETSYRESQASSLTSS